MTIRQINEEITMDIINQMPDNKKQALKNALIRNSLLTSYYGLSLGYITVYKEGWLVQFDGCRCSFSVWAGDNDGEYTFGRKPVESKLHKLYVMPLYDTDKYFENF